MSEAEVSPDSQAPSPESRAEAEVTPGKSALEALQAKVEGLTWMSESDYPFEVSQLPDRLSLATTLAIDEILQITGHEAGTPVEVISVRDFFAPAIQAQDWHEAAEQQRVQRFISLLQEIEQQLSDTQVYRIGTIEIDVYIIGKSIGKSIDKSMSNSKAGIWISLATKAIET